MWGRDFLPPEFKTKKMNFEKIKEINMKSLIKIASLFAVAVVMLGCNCWSQDDCCNPCPKKCCPAPRIWDNNNCCEQGNY
jgi:hypothetical protein